MSRRRYPVQSVLDAIAGLSNQEMVLLARQLAQVAGMRPDDVRAAPDSPDARRYLFLHDLQNQLLAMTPDSFHPERPVSLVGYVLRRQTERMAPAVTEFMKGHKIAQKIRRKPDAAEIESIIEFKKTHTWDETDDAFKVERGVCYRRVLRHKQKNKKHP